MMMRGWRACYKFLGGPICSFYLFLYFCICIFVFVFLYLYFVFVFLYMYFSICIFLFVFFLFYFCICIFVSVHLCIHRAKSGESLIILASSETLQASSSFKVQGNLTKRPVSANKIAKFNFLSLSCNEILIPAYPQEDIISANDRRTLRLDLETTYHISAPKPDHCTTTYLCGFYICFDRVL